MMAQPCVSVMFPYLAFLVPLVSSSHPPPQLLVLSLGGFRHDYFSHADAPVLKSLMKNGAYSPTINNVFPTTMLPNHQSLATGLYPQYHGILARDMYDPDLKRELDAFKDVDTFTKNSEGEPVWVLNEKAASSRFSGSMMWPMANLKINSVSHSQIFQETIPWHKRMEIIQEWLEDRIKPANLIMAYFEEPNFSGHKYGPDSKKMYRKIEELDKAIGKLLKNLQDAKVLNKLNIIITSDHGMTATPTNHVIPLYEILEQDSYDCYGEGPVRMIQPRSGQDIVVYKNLTEAARNGSFTMYSKKEIPDQWYFKKNHRASKILVVADNGYTFHASEKDAVTLGDYGWESSYPEMKPFFIGYGPAFKKEYRKYDEKASIVDLYALMCHILDIHPGTHNGSLSHVSDLLTSITVSKMRAIITNTWVVAGCIVFFFLFIISMAVTCSIIYRKKQKQKQTPTSVISAHVYKRRLILQEVPVEEEPVTHNDKQQLILSSSSMEI